MSIFAHVYPESLTKKAWDKSKGTVAKMAGETGVGAALEGLEKGWKELDLVNLNPDVVLYGAKGLHPDKVLEKVKAVYPKIDKYRAEVKKTVDLTKKVAEDFKKNKLIPSSSTKLVEEMNKTADHWWIALKMSVLEQLCNEAKTALDECKKFADLRAQGAVELKALADKARNEIKAIEGNVSAGLSKLDDSIKRQEAIKKLEDEALAGTGPVIRARGSLPDKFANVVDKLAPNVGPVLRKAAYDSFDKGMREAAALKAMQLQALATISKQRLVAEKTTVPSGNATATGAHVAALKKEVESFQSRASKSLTKVLADQWGKLKGFADSAKTNPGAWVNYDAKKQETIEAFPVLDLIAGYAESLKARIALVPDLDEPTKKAKAGFVEIIDKLSKDATDGVKQKAPFEKLVAELDKGHP